LINGLPRAASPFQADQLKARHEELLLWPAAECAAHFFACPSQACAFGSPPFAEKSAD
jgi:hypothetical protein